METKDTGVVFELLEDGTMLEVTDDAENANGHGNGNAMVDRERRFFTLSFVPPSSRSSSKIPAPTSSRPTPCLGLPRGDVTFEILDDGSMIEVDPSNDNATGTCSRRLSTFRFPDQPLRAETSVEDLDEILAAAQSMTRHEKDDALFREIWDDCMAV